MPDWLQTLLAVSGSGSLLGIAVAAVMRALPFVAKARASSADTALVRAQVALVRAQAKKTSEDVTQQQLKKFHDDMLSRISQAEQRAADAEKKAAECERRNAAIISGLRDRIAELERAIQTIRSVPPPPLLRVERDDPSSARIELVRVSEGDKR